MTQAARPNRGLYVHLPFCPQVCPYCSFAVTTARPRLHRRYIAALGAELSARRPAGPEGPLDTVYFGGGTPTLLEPALLAQVLEQARDLFGFAPGAEITVEANPEGADAARFTALRALGFNRLSLGIQSFADQSLRLLGRRHTGAQAESAIALARSAGFDNLNLDLIFAVPGASAEDWGHTLDRALAHGPEHLSTYALTIEAETPFAKRERQGQLVPPAEEEQAGAYEGAVSRLQAAGFEHYEVSNFARPGRRSRHNWGYWHGGEYLGVGLAAHSFLGGRRSWNQRRMRDYLSTVEAGISPEAGGEVLDPVAARGEALWLGLRTSEGALLPPGLAQRERFRALVAAGYLELRGARVGLTRRGFVLADALSVELMELVEGVELQR
ncbi:MAG: radical SAM family heme chaperone HemW [Candidatus Latescibacteria bacterium]|nr:radical SAM family heme chaperone HemW [Candidatus Latescibacterota bacterium]